MLGAEAGLALDARADSSSSRRTRCALPDAVTTRTLPRRYPRATTTPPGQASQVVQRSPGIGLPVLACRNEGPANGQIDR
jgi:hypothetical protein